MDTTSFVKADSRNLPEVHNVMILEYMAGSNCYNIAEIRGAKALMSSRDSYLTSAVGYVEINRTVNSCIVRAKIVPEHRVANKMYVVTVKLNEQDNVIEDSSCADCAAAAGGCKHSLLLLFWLAKKTEEPSSTSVECYWVKPTLTSARTEHLESKDVYGKKRIKLAPKDNNILLEFQSECRKNMITESLITCFDENDEKNSTNIFNMAIEFVETETDHSFDNFKNYSDRKITKELKNQVSNKTINQANDKHWHYVRQGRITASKLYEAASCNTDGTLVQQILGGYKLPDTKAIKRGRTLEEQVRSEIEKKINIKIDKTGFLLIDSVFGASPDGITKDFVVEIKCPQSIKTMQNYVKKGVIQPKFKAQLNSQMLAAGKRKGLFAVADPSFETNKKVELYWLDIDEVYLKDIMAKALKFWEFFLFPKLLSSAM